MKSYSYLQITIIGLFLISYAFNANSFSTDNPLIIKQLKPDSTDEIKDVQTVLPNVSDSGKEGQNRRNLKYREEFDESSAQKSEPENEDKKEPESLPVPQAASATKTVKKVLGFTLSVFVILLLIAIFAICGCVFLFVRVCCS